MEQKKKGGELTAVRGIDGAIFGEELWDGKLYRGDGVVVGNSSLFRGWRGW